MVRQQDGALAIDRQPSPEFLSPKNNDIAAESKAEKIYSSVAKMPKANTPQIHIL
jgi:hypothetical protein